MTKLPAFHQSVMLIQIWSEKILKALKSITNITVLNRIYSNYYP